MRLGVALRGGFARGLVHIGVIGVLEQNGIPIHCITGVSGATPGEIAEAGRAMPFTDVARWTIGRMGIAGSDRVEGFLRLLLKCYSFGQMRIPLGVGAPDGGTGEAVIFRDRGDVVLPIRASCSYPGLFRPVRCGDRLLSATHVVSLHLPMQGAAAMPTNMFHVIN